MSKTNKEKDLKTAKSHKRTNSNSGNTVNPSNYSGMSLVLTNNQTELFTTTGNIPQATNQNLGLMSQISNTSNTLNTNYNQNQNLPQNNINNLPTMQGLNDNTKQQTEEYKNFSQKVDCVGKSPTARFGHTVVMVSPVKMILFGGAVGDTRNFQFTNETYVLNLITKIWLKLEGRIFIKFSEWNNCALS
jgi:hypothetical protein